MLYRPASDDVGSSYQGGLPLRVDLSVVEEVVDKGGLKCTHIDAIRMFTKEGSKVPNAALGVNGNRELDRLVDQPRLEQGGCLHANLDLFKWAFKLFPLIPSSIIGDALEVALEARTLDVAASPYDAGIYTGGWKVKVEEEEGRREYKTRQMEIMGKSGEVRDRLIKAYEDVLL